MSEIRVRFAPSPTGYLHIGGARTALYNYLFARKTGGKFILRIEDTDAERSTPEATQAILDGLKWLGLDWDEGPYFQSERTELHKSRAIELLDGGLAYRCYCTPEELEARRQQALAAGRSVLYDGKCRDAGETAGKAFAVRFKAPREGSIVVEDMIKGAVEKSRAELDDLIILRSDGSPTYNFCVVVDDAQMGITHVIRGDDHLNNTFRQIPIFKALGHAAPRFAHVPMILGPDKQRLSKRHGSTSVLAYRDAGYLPEAVVNFLARIGWGHGDDEIFSPAELTGKFSIEDVGKSAGVFNAEKLLWMNAHYIKTGDPERLAGLIAPFLEKSGLGTQPVERITKIIPLLRERVKTFDEFVQKSAYFFKDPQSYDEAAAMRLFTPQGIETLREIGRRLAGAEDFSAQAIEKIFAVFTEEKKIGLGKVAQPLRLAVSGRTDTPGIFEIVSAIGKEAVLRRIQTAVEKFSRPAAIEV